MFVAQLKKHIKKMDKKHSTPKTGRSSPIGTIEGFFGKSWSWAARADHLQFLSREHLDFYIYAPKSDPHLRRHWQSDWPANEKNHLLDLRQNAKNLNIDFGLGLSPLELYLAPRAQQRQQLQARITQLNPFELDILCILFDDMRGDLPELAELQIDLAHLAASTSNAKRIIFCPSYYSFDPVLEKVFGKMPSNYWASLNKHLDSSIDIFWTGEKVCSPNYSVEHLTQVTELLGRKPFLWDNYPVNDGALKSSFLHLRPYPQEHSQLTTRVSGHAANPMNQAYLSQAALASLPLAYNSKDGNYQPDSIQSSLLQKLYGPELGQYLLEDLHQFQDLGLTQLSAKQKELLCQKYFRHLSNPAIQELTAWLQGEYVFDPACLTE